MADLTDLHAVHAFVNRVGETSEVLAAKMYQRVLDLVGSAGAVKVRVSFLRTLAYVFQMSQDYASLTLDVVLVPRMRNMVSTHVTGLQACLGLLHESSTMAGTHYEPKTDLPDRYRKWEYIELARLALVYTVVVLEADGRTVNESKLAEKLKYPLRWPDAEAGLKGIISNAGRP